jgi:hypothetical protein
MGGRIPLRIQAGLATIRHMEAKDLATVVVAALGILATVITSWFAMRRQAENLREQLAAQERQFHEQFRNEVLREHFGRLWETRKEGYLDIGKWVIDVREAIRTARKKGGEWAPVDSISSKTMSHLFIYADHDVYAKGDGIRGRYRAVLEMLEDYPKMMTPELRQKSLDRVDNAAFALIHTVRESALRQPDWSAPTPASDTVHVDLPDIDLFN